MPRSLLLTLTILCCATFAAKSQAINLTAAERLLVLSALDSAQRLPQVRAEAAAWHQSSDGFRTAYQAEQAAGRATAGLLRNEGAKAAQWKAKARKRGALNVLLSAGAAALLYLLIKP